MDERSTDRLPYGMTPFVGAREVRATVGCSELEALAHVRAAAALTVDAANTDRVPLYLWESYVRTLFPPVDREGRAPRARPAALLLSKREAARRLCVDRDKTLSMLIESGQLRTVPKNGQLAVPASEVDRLAREGFETRHARPRSRRPPKTSTPPAPRPVSAWKLKI